MKMKYRIIGLHDSRKSYDRNLYENIKFLYASIYILAAAIGGILLIIVIYLL